MDRLSMAAAENPELWAFLGSLQYGEVLCGTVAAIERFGVFVALDDGPEHPAYPGVGFITIPELSWRRFEAASDVVRVGQRVACEFLQFDTWNGEARLSLRAMQPNPFQAVADGLAVGRILRGWVTKLVPFGAWNAAGWPSPCGRSPPTSTPDPTPTPTPTCGGYCGVRRRRSR